MKKRNKKAVGWILIYAYLAVFSFGNAIFQHAWLWALYLASWVPLGITLGYLGFGSLSNIQLSGMGQKTGSAQNGLHDNAIESPSRQAAKKIFGWILICVYLAIFAFLFGISTTGWPLFLFFVCGAPLALALKKLRF
ncbi:MAG: hypothetical protein GXP04_15055 [Alphaproteobacteria bacterium]|nr:hypothetical protein [Alphaproteobacteria bacterium]